MFDETLNKFPGSPPPALSNHGSEGAGSKVSDHLANERTYLAWVRTGITVIALGFVVAKFGLIVRELAPSTPATPYGFSSTIGVALVVAGGAMQLLALKRFRMNQQRIITGTYEPAASTEAVISATVFVTAILLTVYLILTV